MIAAAKLPFSSTVVSARRSGVENNHTCTGVDAMKEPVAISSGVELEAVKPVEPPELLFDAAGWSTKPASAIVAGPADNNAGPFAAFSTVVSIV